MTLMNRFDLASLAFTVALALLASCGKAISDVPDADCTTEQCVPGSDPPAAGAAVDDATEGDGSSTSEEPALRGCAASECVDGDGFCDVGFCTPCVRDDDCGDAPPSPDSPGGDESDAGDGAPSAPGDTPGEPDFPSNLPECLEGECVDGDGFCDEEFCSTCPADADCSSTEPTDPNDPNPPEACVGDDDCACLADECVAGDGFCDENWCDCPDDPDCNDDANERCFNDDDCCLPDECVAGDGVCDEGSCEGCNVDPDC